MVSTGTWRHYPAYISSIYLVYIYTVSTQYLHSIYTVSTQYLHSIYFKVLAKEPHLAGLERDEWLAQVSCRVLQF